MAFDNAPLPEVVAGISKYTTTRIAVADDRAAALRMSGVFQSADANGFVETVTRYLPVVAKQTRGGQIELHFRDQKK